MALPTGFSESTLIQIYAGDPLDYQVNGYLTQHTTASANQKTVITTTAAKHQGVISIDRIVERLTHNS
jgi:hypothetical protein